MTVDAEVFVIGAGPAGLTAAYCLTKEARSVIVIERDPVYVGGISRTVDYKGFLFDIGGHRFFSKSKEVVALWQEILPDDFIARPRLSRIYYNGKFFSYPLKAFEALLKLGVFTSAACMLSYAYAKVVPGHAGAHIPRMGAQPVRRTAVPDFLQDLHRESVGHVVRRDFRRLGRAAHQGSRSHHRRPQRAETIARASAAKPEPADDTVKTLIESFQYPRKGPGMMWEAAARKIAAQGGRILMGRELVGLEFDADRNLWRIEVATTGGERETYTARHVVSSAPLRELVERITPTPISLLHARALRYRDFLTVALMVRKDELFPDNWIYIHDPSVKVGRVQNFRSWSPEMVPDGMSCLGLEYFCFEGDGLWNAPDGELIALAKKEVAQIGLVTADDVVDACVVRQAKAYPVYDEDYRDNIAAIRLDLEGSYPTLHLVGRNGMHRYNNQDHAMMTAMLTARNILAGARLYDVWNVNEDAEYHEAGESGVRGALDSVRLVPEKTADTRAA